MQLPGGSASNATIARTVPSRPQDGQHSSPGALSASIKDKLAPPDGGQTAVEGDIPLYLLLETDTYLLELVSLHFYCIIIEY